MAGLRERAPSQGPAEENSPPRGGYAGDGPYFLGLGFSSMAGEGPDGTPPVPVTRQYAIKGVLFTVAGVVGILFPLLFGLAVEQLMAWLLVIGGGIIIVQFLMVCGAPGTVSFLLLGALHFAVGVWLLLRPIEGLVALTVVLGGWFLVHGFLKLILAYQLRRLRSWPAILISGVLSIGLGVLIVVLTPTYGVRLVGIVFGADFLSTGVAMLVVSLVTCLRRGNEDTEAAREPLLQSGEGPAAPSA